eukprot:5800926-Pyramimonas_sp.AAC.1
MSSAFLPFCCFFWSPSSCGAPSTKPKIGKNPGGAHAAAPAGTSNTGSWPRAAPPAVVPKNSFALSAEMPWDNMMSQSTS